MNPNTKKAWRTTAANKDLLKFVSGHYRKDIQEGVYSKLLKNGYKPPTGDPASTVAPSAPRLTPSGKRAMPALSPAALRQIRQRYAIPTRDQSSDGSLERLLVRDGTYKARRPRRRKGGLADGTYEMR